MKYDFKTETSRSDRCHSATHEGSLMSRQVQRMLDLLILGTLGALPRMLGWSRRSTKTVAVAGIVNAGLGVLPIGSFRPLARLATRRREVAGLFLLAAQFQLTEEESSVRGKVAVMGVALVLMGLAGRIFAAGRVQNQVPM